MRLRNIFPFPLVLLLILGPIVLQKGEVRIEHEPPEQLAPGERAEVTLRVHKGNRDGFAKLELRIPKGFKVKALEKSGASFTFEDGTAKFLWMAMPKGGQFMVKYSLKAKKNVEKGEHTIKGEFRYLEENERKSTSLEDKTLTVKKDSAVADQKGTTPSEKSKTDSSKGVKVQRKVERKEGKGFRVRARIEKGKLEGFAKLVDSVPDGFEASVVEEEGSSFTFEGGKAKFVWMSLPRKSTLEVSYRLEPTTAPKGSYKLKGRFSYLKEGNTVTQELDTSSFELKREGATAKKGPMDTAGARSSSSQAGGTSKSDSSDRKGTAGKKGTTDSSITDVPAPQKGVDYRVQICAGHDEVADDHFAKVYDYQGDYDIDHHKGWLKYLTGKFDVYKKARDKRVYFRKNFDLPGPFVTAYNNGKRITVQEALMITDQEWVQ